MAGQEQYWGLAPLPLTLYSLPMLQPYNQLHIAIPLAFCPFLPMGIPCHAPRTHPSVMLSCYACACHLALRPHPHIQPCAASGLPRLCLPATPVLADSPCPLLHMRNLLPCLCLPTPPRYLGAFLLYATINAALVFGSVAITVFLGPAAAGSGISEVKVSGPGQQWGQQHQD